MGSSRRLTAMGHQWPRDLDRVIAMQQDPDSFVLGTTVWDSSKTMLKFIEQRADLFRKFSSVCELGAGCGGLAGIACAINNHGLSDVVMTDIGPVLPWLRKNVRANLSDKESERVRIEQHAWGTPITNLNAPFDCILCADVVYEKDCVRPLMQSILALSHRKTVIYMANERRAPMVHAEFMKHLNDYFQWKEISRSELDTGYIKDAIQVFEMRPKRRKIPSEMEIKVQAEDPSTVEYHPLLKSKAEAGSLQTDSSKEDPYDRDLWDDLLGNSA